MLNIISKQCTYMKQKRLVHHCVIHNVQYISEKMMIGAIDRLF